MACSRWGYTLVFGVLDILNLAHPAVFTLGGGRGGLTALWLVESAGLTISPFRPST